MSSPSRGGHARRTSSVTREGVGNRSRRTSGAGSGIPVPNTGLRASRLAATQPTYDFLTGGHTGSAAPTPIKPLGQTFRQSTAIKPDIGNEDLRAQIKTLHYEVDSLKHDRDVASLRHTTDLRDAHAKAEDLLQKARADDSANHVPLHKHDALTRALKDAQDALVNQHSALEKRVRAAQDAERTAREEAEEARNDLASMERQHQHQLREIDVRLNALTETASGLRSDLDGKSNALKATQDRLTQREGEVGELESEVLRLKAQKGDAQTLGVIKRELSEQVAHIRQLEKTNREQAEELKGFRKRGKAVEVVEEEKRVLVSKLGLLDDAQRQLREAQLQRQILEDERRTWAAYLEDEEGGTAAYETPEDVAKALVRQRLENASLVQQRGEMQAEQMEKDEMIKSLEGQRSTIQAELDAMKSSTGITTTGAGNSVPSTSTASSSASIDNRTKQRLEKQLSFAKKEIILMREQLRSFDAEEQTYHSDHPFDAAKSARIADLESLLDESRRELASLTSELHTLEGQSSNTPAPTTTPSSPLKRSHATMSSPSEPPPSNTTDTDPALPIGQLTRKIRTLQDSLSTLQSQHTILKAEHTTTLHQLSHLQSSARTRVLSLRDNPTATHEAIKSTTLRALQRENADLKATLLNPSSDNPTGAKPEMVPTSSLQTLQLEIQALQTQLSSSEKRQTRLKQIFTQQTLEFREAVFALLGWKMEMRGRGRFVLALNTRDGGGAEGDGAGGNGEEPGGNEDEDESFIFDGERGTMKVSGGAQSAFAREVEPFFRRWVGGGGTGKGGSGKGGKGEEGQGKGGGWIPGLMASVLLGKVGGLEMGIGEGEGG